MGEGVRMTPEQVSWAKEQFWFERTGVDEEGVYVIGWDSFGSRPALVFYDFDKLTAWAEGQRNLTPELLSIDQVSTSMKT
jgi:hypothetical protein